MSHNFSALPARLWAWLTNDPSRIAGLSADERERLDPVRTAAFLAVHGAVLGVLWVGVSPAAVLVAMLLYVLRMFFITAFYHRYFAHKSFQAGRWTAFVMGALGCTAAQRGPLWWAGHHRAHHQHSDTGEDPHSPAHRGMLWAHTLWFLTRGSFAVPERRVRDWQRHPELVWLDRFDWVPFVLMLCGLYAFGAWTQVHQPGWGTNGVQMVVWGGFVSTVVLYHATYTINSLAHRFGRRRFATADDSRNNVWLALLTLGEGWHNNHHRYPLAARQGFYWWELDLSYLGLRALKALGVVSDLRPVPRSILEEGRGT